jgi:lipopolysaccharide export system permease protein
MWPGFKILDRYIIRKFLGTYLFSIAMIVVVVVVFDYVEKIDDFAATKAPRNEIINYYLNFVPFFVNQFSALFTFISCIFFTSKLAHRTEIVAMLSGGMSFRRLMWPYFISASIITMVSLVLSLWIIPTTQRTRVEFENQYVMTADNQTHANAQSGQPISMAKLERQQTIYRQIEPGTFLYLKRFDQRKCTARKLLLEKHEKGTIRSILEADNVTFEAKAKRWTAQRYITRSFDQDSVEHFERHINLDTLLNISLMELGDMRELVKTMKIEELDAFIKQQRRKGSDMIRYFEVEYHTRFAYPLGTFILTLIGVALSSRKTRGGTGMHIGVGLVLCFSYILLTRIFEVFAGGGTMPIAFAVWLPNMIYTIIAIYLYRKAPK